MSPKINCATQQMALQTRFVEAIARRTTIQAELAWVTGAPRWSVCARLRACSKGYRGRSGLTNRLRPNPREVGRTGYRLYRPTWGHDGCTHDDLATAHDWSSVAGGRRTRGGSATETRARAKIFHVQLVASTTDSAIMTTAFRLWSQPRLPFRLAPKRVCRMPNDCRRSATGGFRFTESRLTPPP
jgi:hypothetical protein